MCLPSHVCIVQLEELFRSVLQSVYDGSTEQHNDEAKSELGEEPAQGHDLEHGQAQDEESGQAKDGDQEPEMQQEQEMTTLLQAIYAYRFTPVLKPNDQVSMLGDGQNCSPVSEYGVLRVSVAEHLLAGSSRGLMGVHAVLWFA